MRFFAISRTSLMLLAIVSATSLAACSRPGTEQPARNSQTSAVPVAAIAGAIAPAGAERFGDDPHPERVDLSQVTKESLAPQSTGGFAPTDVLVHKQDGKARFNWVEQNGRWSQVPATTP